MAKLHHALQNYGTDDDSRFIYKLLTSVPACSGLLIYLSDKPSFFYKNKDCYDFCFFKLITPTLEN